MTIKINSILSNNKEKIFLKGKYTKAIIHKCGKKRLELINKIRKEEE